MYGLLDRHYFSVSNSGIFFMTEASTRVDFRTDPSQYKHWALSFDRAIATLAMDVAEDGGIRPGYKLKLNSYALGVDIELHDALQLIRFEHHEVRPEDRKRPVSGTEAT